jgi:hypothetical protein
LGGAGNIVAAIMEEAAEKAAAQAKGRHVAHRRRGRALIVLVPVFLVLTGWNLLRTTQPPPPVPDDLVVEGAHMAVYVAAEALFQHQDSTGTLPRSLRAIGLEDVPVRYEPDGREFLLTARARGRSISYDSRDDLNDFVASLDLRRSTDP